MARLPDLIYVALFAVALPLWDYFVSWPSFERQSEAAPARARKRLWVGAIGWLWALVALGMALWLVNDRSWTALGFSIPVGWRLWVASSLVLLLVAYYVQAVVAVGRDPKARASVREQFSGKIADVMPHTRPELYWFGGVSLTAGFCEEFLFRGYLIWALAPWLGWWGAAALSVLVFATGHAYQGWSGVLRTGAAGILFTLMVALFGSLWPAILLHILVDLGSGTLAWQALREEQDLPETQVA